ncbi:16S rRNA (guanine(966)-N(2))-methyltransferase RsmD [Catonella massiliensis]|jgi:RNA methyltransferase, rsmD family|uniref:16S rRNA (Guanine(966)-N(2))-methyltransferase RsmD n=1 Tax=Catonella massiliensis TaxID=2799636 RepID=A0ABS1IZ88_9FIRM|nr:16S rRNA (guanine(966)-N(2))-methyltransferase RsmD [Catonella massiliensis]MBK5897202.1 16S rRNA (guanine(966)-N(2))-methyltransferase RsmD [Catonella massiliensis]
MRVIAGIARSVPLITPRGLETRPTSDQIKETLFNMLQGYTEGANFLDLYAGSGQIGIEALSRGAEFAAFVEKSDEAVKCIKANVDKTKFADKSMILKLEVLSGIRTLELEKKRFDIVFLDPPYNQGLEQGILTALVGSAILNDEVIIIVEASKNTDFSFVDYLGLKIVKDKIYKNNRHLFLRKNNLESKLWQTIK